MLEPLGLSVVSLLDYPNISDIEETGSTFEENALIKAESIARQFNVLTLADDSGLIVPALDGAPGIYSARYSGEPKDDHRNNLKLLEEMKALHGPERAAYFISVLALAYPNQESLVIEGRVEGNILTELSGEEGFGYDPLFYYEPAGKSFANMTMQEKNKISHRAQAMNQLSKILPKWLEELK